MPAFVFKGTPEYWELASRDFDQPELFLPVPRLVPLAAVANLCAQATHAAPAQVAAILARAEFFRTQLRIASHSADLMLAAVRAALACASGTAENVEDPDTLIPEDRRTQAVTSSQPARTSNPTRTQGRSSR